MMNDIINIVIHSFIMAALLLDEAPNATVKQWYNNIYLEFKLYWTHYGNLRANWGCCGRCTRDEDLDICVRCTRESEVKRRYIHCTHDEDHDDDQNSCGILPAFTLNVNDTLFTDEYVPSVMPYVAENYGHVGKFDSCEADCSECREFRQDSNNFHQVLGKFVHWRNKCFKTNAELEAYISAMIYKLSQSNFSHYASNIETLMHNTLKEFYQVLFVSGRHTKAARR
jgi:hypothetical protein